MISTHFIKYECEYLQIFKAESQPTLYFSHEQHFPLASTVTASISIAKSNGKLAQIKINF